MVLTVIVPTYNRLALLRTAIASLLAQKDELSIALDILVVDDGSTDGTNAWLAQQSHEPALRVVTQQNSGVTTARNTGLTHLLPDTSFVTFLDSDDASPRGALAAQLAPLLADQSLELTYGRLLAVDAIDAQNFLPTEGAKRLEFVGIQLSCAMFRRDLIERIGMFDLEFRQAEDADYLLRTFESGARFLQTETVCLYYYRHAGNMTKNLSESRRCFALALFKSMKRRRADPSISLIKPAFETEHVGKMDFY